MPIVPASLVVHLALTSLVSVTWAFLSIRWLKIRYPAARALILTVSVLLPVGGLVKHLLPPQYCVQSLSVATHLACMTGQTLGKTGELMLSSSLVAVVSRSAAIWLAHRHTMRGAVPLEPVTWDDPSLAASIKRAVKRSAGSSWASRRPPQVFVTEKAGICCTVGVVRPAVLMSREFFRTMDAEELEAVLAHEFAHIKRRDNVIGLMSTLLRALTFFSPAAYVAIKQYMYEREKAADDLAVQTTGDPLALASAIIKVARSRPGMASANATGDSKLGLTARVQRLIDGGSISGIHEGQRERRLPQVMGAIAGFIVITLLLC